MTCIVAVVTPKGVLFGADSLAQDDDTNHTMGRGSGKVGRVGPYTIGVAGSCRVLNLLLLTLGKHLSGPARPTTKHVVTAVVPAMRACLAAGGVELGSDSPGFEVLLAAHGAIFEIDSEFAAHESPLGYAAAGTGALVACGALFATASDRIAPRRRVRLALEAAEEHAKGVRRPWRFVATRT